jgi:disulfide bond formation protein DsbB
VTQTKTITTFERALNTLELAGIIAMLFMAFAFQVILNELPCPLCLLQRVGFLGIAFGFLLNLRFGLRPSHYSVVLISAILTSFVALRQISLHVLPGSGTYGNAVFGLHLYTWSFIVAMLVIITTTLQLGVDRQYHKPNTKKIQNMKSRYLTHGLFIVLSLLILTNLVSVLLECGIEQCPDNPVHYQCMT